jgi:hypothetical protein
MTVPSGTSQRGNNGALATSMAELPPGIVTFAEWTGWLWLLS